MPRAAFAWGFLDTAARRRLRVRARQWKGFGGLTVAVSRTRGPGRPPRYRSRAEIEEKIEAYFKSCEGEPVEDPETGKPMIDKRGNLVYAGRRPPTVTGLALALGFTTRQSLLNYEGRKEFQAVIQKAKTRIEMYAEERLYDRDGCIGARFNLQNNFRGWNGESRGGEDIEDLSPLARLLGED